MLRHYQTDPQPKSRIFCFADPLGVCHLYPTMKPHNKTDQTALFLIPWGSIRPSSSLICFHVPSKCEPSIVCRRSPKRSILKEVLAGSNQAHITMHIQQSHSSSPQSQPKHGFETDLMGFLIEPPELVEGSVQSNGVEIEVTAMAEEDEIYVLSYGQSRK